MTSTEALAREGVERVAAIQAALRDDGLAGWLLYDFHGTNPIARSVLHMERAPNAAKTTRRWFYLVPANGEPNEPVNLCTREPVNQFALYSSPASKNSRSSACLRTSQPRYSASPT